MTALIMERMRSFDRWTYKRFAIEAGTDKIWKHGLVGFDANGMVKSPDGVTPLFIIGIANETKDMSAEADDSTIDVNLCKEIEVEWWMSAGGISAANVGQLCYAADDNTVGLVDTGAIAGRIWAYSAIDGVAVEKLPFVIVVPAGP